MDTPLAKHPAGFTVREARLGDLSGAVALIRRVLRDDLGVSYNPAWHAELDDPQRVYLDNPRHALFVALDDVTGEVIGTTALRATGPRSPPRPRWLAERYGTPDTAQLFRVCIAPAARRRGVARVLVEAARRFVATEGGYRTIYLHTDPRVPGAEAFWRAMPTTELYDARRDSNPAGAHHFEPRLPADGRG